MNRSIGNGHRPAAGESRMGRAAVLSSVSEPLPVAGGRGRRLHRGPSPSGPVRQPGKERGARAVTARRGGIAMSWPGGSSQPQQARLAQALRDFGDGTDQAVRAWAGQLTMRQALDITFVLTNILRLLGNHG